MGLRNVETSPTSRFEGEREGPGVGRGSDAPLRTGSGSLAGTRTQRPLLDSRARI